MDALISMVVGTAWAQDASAAVGSSGVTAMLFSYLPLVLIFGIFYLLIIRPQSRAAKAHEALIAGLKKGDAVQLTSGVLGVVQQVGEATVLVKVDRAVELTVMKTAVHQLVAADVFAPMAGERLQGRGPVIDAQAVDSGPRKKKSL